jgi:cytochrome b561
MALLVIVGLIGVELHEFFPKGTDLRAACKSVHFQAGLMVFLLLWVRLYSTLTDRVPDISPAQPLGDQRKSKLVHVLLYLGMMVLPILGVLYLQAAEKPLTFLGMALPTLIGPDKELAHDLKEIHELIGNAMIVLIVLHAGAALWHHFKLRDNTLLRMLRPR